MGDGAFITHVAVVNVPRSGSIDGLTRARSSAALNNLRGVAILIVLGFHSVLAYLGSISPAAFSFDVSPYQWRAFPIVDNHRWFGFDLFCAWQDVYLMSLMFFLSALFTWPSLGRKGARKFLGDRFLRLGVPFAFAVIVVMPVALYPVYRVTAADPGLLAYVRHYLALPFWPNGPMWFLWQLLALAVAAAGLHRFAPRLIGSLGQWSDRAATHPGQVFAGIVVIASLAYVPPALAFTPWAWNEHGLFAMQFSRPLLYAVFYVFGLAVGANGLGRGLLAPDEMLAQRWPVWLTAALGSVFLWMALTALAMSYPVPAPLGLQVVVGISFAMACGAGCFFVIAASMRFETTRSRMLDSFARNSFGMYVLHYVFVVWLQYTLLGLALLAIVKAAIVFCGTVALAWSATIAMRFVPFGTRLIGAEPRAPAPGPLEPAHFAARTNR